MDLDFKGRVAIVTGAGNGLGRRYALELARRGASVVVNDYGVSPGGIGFTDEYALKVVEEIKSAGGAAVADCHSVSDDVSAQAIIQGALERFGRADILINNAGFLRDRSLLKMTTDDFDMILKVHLYGPFFLARAVLPSMRQNNYGRIVMVTSTSGLYGNFGQANYDAAKLGIVGLMHAAKEEGKKYNILVNAIAPVAGSRLGAGLFPDEIMDRLKPEYVAPAVVYLCSEKCACSGHIITAGGGFFARDWLAEGEGYYFGTEEITDDAFAEKWESITDMTRARHYENMMEVGMAWLTKATTPDKKTN